MGLTLVPADPVESAWERYQKLVLAAQADTALWSDRAHCLAIFEAYEAFRQLYVAEAA